MSPDVKDLLESAIERLSEDMGNAGCNDLEIPNTREMKELWNEYNYWNSGLTGPNIEDPNDQWIPWPEEDGETVVVHDYFIIFLLRKHLGLDSE